MLYSSFMWSSGSSRVMVTMLVLAHGQSGMIEPSTADPTPTMITSYCIASLLKVVCMLTVNCRVI